MGAFCPQRQASNCARAMSQRRDCIVLVPRTARRRVVATWMLVSWKVGAIFHWVRPLLMAKTLATKTLPMVHAGWAEFFRPAPARDLWAKTPTVPACRIAPQNCGHFMVAASILAAVASPGPGAGAVSSGTLLTTFFPRGRFFSRWLV